MNNIIKSSLINSLGTLIYITIIATIMSNAERIFGKMNDVLGPIAFLMLFTLSALIVGGLILGKPVILYLDGKKKEAIQMVFTTAGWLAAFTIIAMIILAIR